MNVDTVITRMRIPTAFAAVLLSGLALLGVPSAAADELPTPVETSEGSAPADETVATPTPEPSDVPTNEGAAPQLEESVAPTEAADPSPPAEETDGPQQAEGSEATGAAGAAEPAAPTEEPEPAPVEGAPISSQAFSEPVLDPRASLGDLSCANLTLSATLDNTRSTGAVEFFVATEGRDDEDYTYSETYRLDAGATKVVEVPVTDNMPVVVRVAAWDPSDEFLSVDLAYSALNVRCTGAGPRASIGNVDCGTLTVPVILDNSQSLTGASFSVIVDGFDSVPYSEWSSDEDFAVPAGESTVVPVDVNEDSEVHVLVWLTDDDEGNWLAGRGFGVDCVAREGGFTTATIGDLDCTTRTIPVSIDNRSVSNAIGVGVYADRGEAGDFYDEFVVASGATRVVPVRVPRSHHDPVGVFVDNFDAQTTLDDYSLARRVVRNDCPTTAARPTVAVKGVKLGLGLAQTGGFDFRLPLLGVALFGTGSLLALAGRRPRH